MINTKFVNDDDDFEDDLHHGNNIEDGADEDDEFAW